MIWKIHLFYFSHIFHELLPGWLIQINLTFHFRFKFSPEITVGKFLHI